MSHVTITRGRLRTAMAGADLDEICAKWGTGGFEQLVDVVLYNLEHDPLVPGKQTPALDHLAELLDDSEAEPAWGRPIAAALVELADMLRARRPQ